MSANNFQCGFVALVGKPNVGKSTLLNRLVGQKISITSRRPQTTRHRILGISTTEHSQVIYVDTPGLHARESRAMNRYLNRTAADSLADVDLVVFVLDGRHWTADDEWVLQKLRARSCPVIAVVNKVDRIEDKSSLLPVLQELATRYDFAEIIPLSARTGAQVPQLADAVLRYLPKAPPLYDEDQVTDRSQRFLAAELVREKLFRKLGEEIPYGLTVEIESFRDKGGVLHIHALIWVEKTSHKPIVIGARGQLLKDVGREAREDMQEAFDQKVFLQLWVKVKEGWADDARALQRLGYDER